MPIDIKAQLAQLQRDGTLQRIARDRLAQFGAKRRVYLGATVLPEREVKANLFRDDSVRYRSVIAVDGTRYSPVQIRGGMLVGGVLVELMNNDIGSTIDGDAYDALIDYLERDASLDAILQLTDWQDQTLNRPMLEKNELYRWQAIVDAVVARHGNDNFIENVPFPNPAGHRVNAAGAWSDNNYDPLPDMVAGKTLFASKGYEPGRAFAGTPVIAKLLNNAKIRARTGGALVQSNGTVVPVELSSSLEKLNNILVIEGLPPIEQYDLQFATPTATQFFLKRDVWVMVAATGRDARIDLGDTIETVEDTLGYVGIGRAAGQPTPGRAVFVEHKENKPPRVEGESWQTSGPVINEPEAVYVVKSIT